MVFGGSGVGSTGTINLSSLSGIDGFVVKVVNDYDNSGVSVSGAGDINDDGVDDLIIGASEADPNGNDRAGASYVVFGGSGVGVTGQINLSSLSGTDGFAINGVNVDDRSGRRSYIRWQRRRYCFWKFRCRSAVWFRRQRCTVWRNGRR